MIRRGFSFRRDVAIVEAVVRRTELFHELEADTHAVAGIFDRVFGRFPRANHRAGPERITSRASKRVPIGDAEFEVVLHRFAFDYFLCVVVMKGKRIFAGGTFERNA